MCGLGIVPLPQCNCWRFECHPGGFAWRHSQTIDRFRSFCFRPGFFWQDLLHSLLVSGCFSFACVKCGVSYWIFLQGCNPGGCLPDVIDSGWGGFPVGIAVSSCPHTHVGL